MSKLPVISRIQAVKDLFLNKLDIIIAKTESIFHFLSHQINENIQIIRQHVNLLLENDAFLLQYGIDINKSMKVLLEYIEKNQVETRQQEEVLFNKIELIEKSTQELSSSHKSKTQRIINESDFQNVERGLMKYLYSYLPNRSALDIGANKGDLSHSLLQTGYEVYAFEPFTPVFEKLTTRFENEPNFHAFPLALGSKNETRELHLVSDKTITQIYKDHTFYSSLHEHSLPENLIFTDTFTVNVTTLESLHKSSKIPENINLINIDTEGFDLEVIRGMGSYHYPVVITQFWDSKFPFDQSGVMNLLEDIVREMKQKKYYWYIVVYRVWGSPEVSYYCNHQHSLENSWGKIFFFQDYNIFTQASIWCSSVIPVTYFTS